MLVELIKCSYQSDKIHNHLENQFLHSTESDRCIHTSTEQDRVDKCVDEESDAQIRLETE